MSARYPVGTIQQMAAIPIEARARFLAELPELLDAVARMEEAKAFIAAAGLGHELVTRDPEWVDDSLNTATVSIAMPDGGEVSATYPLKGGAA